MFTLHSPRRFAAAALVALILTACGQAVARPQPSSPTAPPAEQPSQPVASPSPSPTPVPSQPPAPTKTPAPTPTPTPLPIVRHEVPIFAEATADGVNVRVRPGLDAPLVEGFDRDTGKVVRNTRLFAGHTVGVTMGPVIVDGIAWYLVNDSDDWSIDFGRGWVAGTYLAKVDDVPSHQPYYIFMDGLGSGSAASADVPAAPLTVNVMAAPLDGEASCEAEVVLTGTDGQVVTVASATLTGPTMLFASPLENVALTMERAGQVTLQVRSDCTWAGTLSIPGG